ncbi:MAG TPA: hypothetical protein VMV49_09730 [Candidatus Deferrimicrobium sp.]|nr:hypothetical protein [Candidatus Deferrimicrobium sp.]
MPHSESGMLRRRRYFLRRTYWGLIGCILLLLLFVWLITEGIVSIEYGIFIISCSLFLIFLDFYWFGDIIFSKKYWKEMYKMRDEYGVIDSIKDVKQRYYWRNYYQKRIMYYILMVIILIIVWSWTFIMIGRPEILIIGFIIFPLQIVLLLYRYSDILWGTAKEGKKKRKFKKYL